MTDLDETQIRAAFERVGLSVPVRFWTEACSTNQLALDDLRHQPAYDVIYCADIQTAGRGRMGRAWYAPAGTALLCSYVARIPQTRFSRAGMIGAVAVCEALEEQGIPRVEIKWPNDVQVSGRKICGVLPEAAWDGERLLGVVIGMGINVRVPFAGTPFAESAINAEDVLGKRINRAELLAVLVGRVRHWLARVEDEALFASWRGRLNMLGKQISLNAAQGQLKMRGTAEAVTPEGALLLRDDAGKLQHVIAGELVLA